MSTKTESTTIVEYNFAETLSAKFQCMICAGLLKVPHLTECCGHSFCAECLQKWRDSQETTRCPHCREESFVHIHDKRLQREINELRIFCSSPSKNSGCAWVGGLSELGEHLKTCGYVETKCTKCSEPVLRKNEEFHLTTSCKEREVTCPYCQQKGPYSAIFSLMHIPNCTGSSVLCPSGCTTEPISRSLLQHHLEDDCPNAVVECPLKEAGCQAKLQRKNILSHISSDSHLKLVMDFIKKQSAELKMLTRYKDTMEASVKEITSEIDDLVKPSSSLSLHYKTQLSSFKDKLSVHPILWLSQDNTLIILFLDLPTQQSRPFYIGDGYKFRIVVSRDKRRQTLTVSVHMLQGEHDDKIKWPPNINLHSVILHGETFHFNLGNKQCHPLPSSRLFGNKSLEICKCKKDVVMAGYTRHKMSFTLRLEACFGSSIETGSLVPKMEFLSLQKPKNFSTGGFMSKPCYKVTAQSTPRLIKKVRRRNFK